MCASEEISEDVARRGRKRRERIVREEIVRVALDLPQWRREEKERRMWGRRRAE